MTTPQNISNSIYYDIEPNVVYPLGCHYKDLYGVDCEPMKIKFMVKKLSPNQDIPNTKNRKKLAQKLIQVQKEKCSCNHDLNSKFFA